MDIFARPIAIRRTQAERSALSDVRMVDAAIGLMASRGISGMTLKEVGELAGYSRAMAGWRFGTKANLCAFIIRTVGDEWLRALNEAVRNKHGLAAIHAATDAHSRFVHDGAERIRVFYMLWFHSTGPDPELKQVIVKVHERRQRDVEAWIEQGISAGAVREDAEVKTVAAQFCATIIGIVYQWLVEPTAQHQIHDLHQGLKQQMSRALARDITDAKRPQQEQE